MGHWWKYALRIIAVISASAPGIMNVFGCFDSFADPVIAYFAAGVGLCADVYLLASHSAIRDAKRKKREWARIVGIAIWLACALWTGLSSASWLQHKLEAAQAPVEQQKQAQTTTEADRQTDLASERETLKKEEEIARTGKTKEIRDNATQLAEKTRGRLRDLQKQNTLPAKVENAPIKSPFAGYEKLVTFLLLAFSQGCWLMAVDEEPEAEIGTARKPEIPAGNDAPMPPRKRQKQAGNVGRKSKPGNGEGAKILKFRKPPTREEISALREQEKSFDEIATIFGYKSGKQMRNIFNGRSGSQAAG
jgi:hypothetical protein